MAKLMLVNPKKRKKAKRRSVAKRKAPRRITRYSKSPVKRRRNPSSRGTGVFNQVKNAGIGAAGALAVDVAMSKLPIPANFTATPTMAAATQGVVSIALGMLIAKFGKKRDLGRKISEGGLTVALHGMGKGLIGPSIGLSSYDGGLLGYDDGLLGFQSQNQGGMGYYNPAPSQVGDWEDNDDWNDDY
jgi:hypothetical protein